MDLDVLLRASFGYAKPRPRVKRRLFQTLGGVSKLLHLVKIENSECRVRLSIVRCEIG